MRYLLPLVLLAGCGNKKPPEATKTKAAEPTMTFHQGMQGNLEAIGEAHIALIRGDLDAVKAMTGKLASMPKVDSFPEPWLEMQASLMASAKLASESEDLDQASARVVGITKQCADCHTTVSDGPTFYVVEAPDVETNLNDRMKHHATGADMMWKGMIVDDKDLVHRGAVRLAEGVLPPQNEEPFPAEILAIEEVLLKDAAVAADSTRMTEQRDLLGKMLPRCGTCHRAAGIKPKIEFNPTLK